jgi:hypothetical protein
LSNGHSCEEIEIITNTPSIKTVAIVGCGVVGSRWATYYLANGF